ncbi:MAG: cytidylate kinase family protein [Eubacterium sp.]
MKKYVICIGREFCSGGREIGKMLAQRLNISYYDAVELRARASELGVDEGVFEMFDEQPTRSFLFSIVMDPLG